MPGLGAPAKHFLSVLAVLLTGACERAGDARPASDAASPLAAEAAEPLVIDTIAQAEARRVAAELEPALMDRLVTALASGGTTAGFAFCIDSAPALIARLTADGGRVVRRVSAQARNPTNAPDSVEAQVLERMVIALGEGRLAADTTFMTADTDGRRTLHYARPILIRQECLACHGDPAGYSARVRDVLARRYPDDLAINYTSGALRGIVSVRLEVP